MNEQPQSLNEKEPPVQQEVGTSPPSWRVAAVAVVVTAIILTSAVACAMASDVAVTRWLELNQPRAFGPGERETLLTLQLALFLISFQIATLLLTFAVIRASGLDWAERIGIRWPKGGGRGVALSLAALIVAALGYAAIVLALDADGALEDVRPFAQMVRTDAGWLMALAAAVGAPIAEEILFRGYLYGVLSRSAVGKIAGGAVTAGLWAAMHFDHTVYGVIAIVLIGLYLAWLRERTGSLLAPIACHAAYNGMITLALFSTPERLLQAT